MLAAGPDSDVAGQAFLPPLDRAAPGATFPRTAATFACLPLAACAANEPTYYKRGLEFREGLPGPESRYVADSLNDLAVVRRTPSSCDDAMPLLERPAQITEKAGNRFDLALMLDNIGHVRAAQKTHGRRRSRLRARTRHHRGSDGTQYATRGA